LIRALTEFNLGRKPVFESIFNPTETRLSSIFTSNPFINPFSPQSIFTPKVLQVPGLERLRLDHNMLRDLPADMATPTAQTLKQTTHKLKNQPFSKTEMTGAFFLPKFTGKMVTPNPIPQTPNPKTQNPKPNPQTPNRRRRSQA
jgi:hypothetical protein